MELNSGWVTLSCKNVQRGSPPLRDDEEILPFSYPPMACFEFNYSITFGTSLRCSATLFLAFLIPGSAAYSSTNLKQQFFL
jgi:hypothetical protein